MYVYVSIILINGCVFPSFQLMCACDAWMCACVHVCARSLARLLACLHARMLTRLHAHLLARTHAWSHACSLARLLALMSACSLARPHSCSLAFPLPPYHTRFLARTLAFSLSRSVSRSHTRLLACMLTDILACLLARPHAQIFHILRFFTFSDCSHSHVTCSCVASMHPHMHSCSHTCIHVRTLAHMYVRTRRSLQTCMSIPNTFFSELAHHFFLIFCMKLGDHKRRKVMEPDFSQKRAQNGLKIDFCDNFSKLNH